MIVINKIDFPHWSLTILLDIVAANVKIDGKILFKKWFNYDFIVKLYFRKISHLGKASVGSYLSLPVHSDDA